MHPSLGYTLHTYIEDRHGNPSPILTDPKFPADVMVKHCTAVWREAYEYLLQNRK